MPLFGNYSLILTTLMDGYWAKCSTVARLLIDFDGTNKVINTDEVTLTDETTKYPRRCNHTTDEGREAIQYSQ